MSPGWRRGSTAPSAGSPAVWPATRPSQSVSAGQPPRHRRKARSFPLAPVMVECGDINGIEAFADSEQEDADDDESDQDREGYADLDDERHALGAGGRQHQSVLKRHESDDLTDRIAAGHHDQKSQQHDPQGEGPILARPR